MQCIISALKSESQPIIDSFGLKRNNSFPFPVYQNQNISQLIVGVGKKNVEQRISTFFNHYKYINMFRFIFLYIFIYRYIQIYIDI